MAKATLPEPQNKVTYNPTVNYKWDEFDVFEITGKQLAVLYHCLNKEALTPEGASPIQKYDAYNVIIDLLKMGVEQGVIVPTELQEMTPELDQQVHNLFKSENNG